MAVDDVGTVSNETSILTSLENLLPTTAYRVLIGCLFLFALLLFWLRRTTLSRTMNALHAAMCEMEWVYYQSVEAACWTQATRRRSTKRFNYYKREHQASGNKVSARRCPGGAKSTPPAAASRFAS
ncbi:hypothetical protein C8R46DRAFT_1357724 [Mycena filopes]|nr:hypothetical protein C8R46DRAFT_1357724 [Mycena filopes]